jgi:hypothetical protein
LPEHHLSRFVVEIIEQLDLKPVERAYGTSGSDPFHPVAAVSSGYGCATGAFSSCKLESATYAKNAVDGWVGANLFAQTVACVRMNSHLQERFNALMQNGILGQLRFLG